ncbi:MAG: DsbA family protein [Pseudomonadota bacterium]
MFRLLTAAFLMIALPASAFDVSAMTEAERSAFREEIRAYLLENPEVLVEAINALEEREAQAEALADGEKIIANAAAIYEDGHSWVGGNPEGDVTIVEFLDYRCGFCRRAHPVISELLETDKNVRLIVKEFPILGEDSVMASRFALAVKALHGDDAYKTVHDKLMELRAGMNEVSLTSLAEREGLDPAAIFAEMESPAITEVIETNRALGRTLEINGTPSFIVGDQVLRGFLPIEGMRAVVDATREG